VTAKELDFVTKMWGISKVQKPESQTGIISVLLSRTLIIMTYKEVARLWQVTEKWKMRKT
jgi:hypothetical protein